MRFSESRCLRRSLGLGGCFQDRNGFKKSWKRRKAICTMEGMGIRTPCGRRVLWNCQPRDLQLSFPPTSIRYFTLFPVTFQKFNFTSKFFQSPCMLKFTSSNLPVQCILGCFVQEKALLQVKKQVPYCFLLAFLTARRLPRMAMFYSNLVRILSIP